MQTQELTPVQNVEVECRPSDLSGAPAKLQDGTFAITSDTPAAVGNGVVSKDGELDPTDQSFVYLATCEVLGKAGDTAILTVSGDADLGAGVDTISDQFEALIVHGNAANLGLRIRPVPKPVAPPVA